MNYSIKIKFNKGCLEPYFPYKEVVANNYYSFYSGLFNDGRVRYYYSVKPIKDIDEIFSIEGKPHPSLDGFITSQILVNNVPFERRFENFFTPQNLNEKSIAAFFNSIAPRYESLIDRTLNIELIKRIFKEIQQKYSIKKAKSTKSQPSSELMLLEQTNALSTPKNLQQNRTSEKFKILDYGVGTGLSYKIYSNKKLETRCRFMVFGTDISGEMLQICKMKGIPNVTLCKYAQTCYPNNYFDAVFTVFVTHYFIDKRPFEEIYRILKPGGLFIFNTKPTSTPVAGLPLQKRRTQISLDPCYKDSLLRSGFNGVRCRLWSIKSPEKERQIPIYITNK